MIETEEFSREDALLGILSNIERTLAPSGGIVAFVVEGSLEDLAYAVMADFVLVDGSHLSEWRCLQTYTALAKKAVHVERVCVCERVSEYEWSLFANVRMSVLFDVDSVEADNRWACRRELGTRLLTSWIGKKQHCGPRQLPVCQCRGRS